MIASPPRDSAATEHATRFVGERRERAMLLGLAIAETVTDAGQVADETRAALTELADPAYAAEQGRVAPGIGPVHGVRLPLLTALRRGFDRGTRRDSATMLLLVADRLLREPTMEPRWLAIGVLDRTLTLDPVRTWQLLRAAAQDAGDWITVDTLARPFGRGILLESYRWAELEQLTISPSRWERRLVGSTIATIPYADRRRGRTAEVAARGLAILATLIGDADPDVQKALSWAYRSMAVVDLAATTAALEEEAERAAQEADGSRAWVIRDALPKLAPADAERIRTRLAGVRRRTGAPPTSTASALAARFATMGLGRPLPKPPLT